MGRQEAEEEWGEKRDWDVHVTVVCVYAPTARATPGVKGKFSSNLQDTLDKIPSQDILILVGGFNASFGVGSLMRKSSK